jgi:DNA-binding LacI/PurR family transcriptional regulator
MDRVRVTSAEVAARAGVSQSAVSRVFTPGASASAKTAEKVRRAAEELGYRPNVLARAMVSGKSRIIGLVVAYLDNQFYPVALERLSNALQARGYRILIFTAANATDGVEKLVQDLMDYQVDGIIAASVSMSSTLADRARARGIPVVLFNRGQDARGFSNVTSDNFAGGRKVAEFLLAGGHERIAHIAGWQGSSTGRDRQAGFLRRWTKPGSGPSRSSTACTSARSRWNARASSSPDGPAPTRSSWATITWPSRSWMCCAARASCPAATFPSSAMTTCPWPPGPPTTSPRCASP